MASSSVLPVPTGAFAGWAERDARVAAESAVWSDPSLSGPELTRAAAIAGAPANVWRHAALPGYLERLAKARFTAEWARPWRAGTLPSPRLADPVGSLSALDIPILLLHGRQDMTFPASLADQAAAQIPSAQAVVLDQAGHMAHVDQPERWLASVRSFLTDRKDPAL